MIRLLINGLAASAGGGLTYLINLIPHFAQRDDVEATILVTDSTRPLLRGAGNVSILEEPTTRASGARFLHEQRTIPALIRESRTQVLISAGNFALRKSPVPQILLSRNALYTSKDFTRDLRYRGELRLLIDTRIRAWLARRSIRWADRTVAPTQSFAQELRDWTGVKIDCIYHGFDVVAFSRDVTPLPANVQAALQGGANGFRVLFVSHYNYYRNFETLFRALPLLRDRLQGRPFKLYLTCKLSSAETPGSYQAESARALVDRLEIRNEVVELGAIPYGSLHQLYSACDLYVTPAYAESFAHPLVEAMSCGLPIVASDLSVHREMCRDAAVYFPRFSHESLAERIAEVAGTPELSQRLSAAGEKRVRDFSWAKHVDQLVALACELLAERRST